MQETYIPTFCVKFLSLFLLVFGICRDQKGSQVNNKMPYFTNKHTEQSHKFEINNEYLNTLKCPLLVINSN